MKLKNIELTVKLHNVKVYTKKLNQITKTWIKLQEQIKELQELKITYSTSVSKNAKQIKEGITKKGGINPYPPKTKRPSEKSKGQRNNKWKK